MKTYATCSFYFLDTLDRKGSLNVKVLVWSQVVGFQWLVLLQLGCDSTRTMSVNYICSMTGHRPIIPTEMDKSTINMYVFKWLLADFLSSFPLKSRAVAVKWLKAQPEGFRWTEVFAHPHCLDEGYLKCSRALPPAQFKGLSWRPGRCRAF